MPFVWQARLEEDDEEGSSPATITTRGPDREWSCGDYISFFMVSASSMAGSEFPAPAPPPPPPLPFFDDPPLPTMLLMKSIGTGKMMVEFFSAAIELRV